jgi:hypothetical protein
MYIYIYRSPYLISLSSVSPPKGISREKSSLRSTPKAYTSLGREHASPVKKKNSLAALPTTYTSLGREHAWKKNEKNVVKKMKKNKVATLYVARKRARLKKKLVEEQSKSRRVAGQRVRARVNERARPPSTEETRGKKKESTHGVCVWCGILGLFIRIRRTLYTHYKGSIYALVGLCKEP